MVTQPQSDAATDGIKVSVIHSLKNVVSKDEITAEPKLEMEKKEDTTMDYLTMFVAELVGTGLLMFLGCMGCINNYDEPKPTHHFGGITFGLTVMLIIQLFGHISGAHLNPAVTIATVLFRMLTIRMAVVYIVAQFVGATLGFGLLKILASNKYAPDGFCMTTIESNISAGQGLGIEIVITTVLILICCAVWDKRNEAKGDSVPLRFGFAIAAISMAAGPLTGASMNTARSFAPVVFGGSWQDQWIYWLGPNVAAFIGCGIYKFLFSEREKLNERENIHLNEISSQEGDKV